jgi:hypothetical protein
LTAEAALGIVASGLRSRFLGCGVLALSVLLASGCGSGKPQRTLSAFQVVSTLRRHGVEARVTWSANKIVGSSGMNGFLGLSGVRLAGHWGVIAFVQASFHPVNAPASAVGPPYVDVVVTRTVEQAQGLAHRAPSGSNGRTFNVANVVLQVYRSTVPRIAAAVLDLMAEARARGARGGLILRAT